MAALLQGSSGRDRAGSQSRGPICGDARHMWNGGHGYSGHQGSGVASSMGAEIKMHFWNNATTLRAADLIAYALRLLAAAVHVLLMAATAAGAGTVFTQQTTEAGTHAPAIEYDVYVPDDQCAQGTRLPVVYFLHGFGASGAEWQSFGDLPATLDQLISNGTIAPMIAVMPSAGKSWYVDSARFGGPGDYESAIVLGLVKEIDSRFPTLAHANGRSVVGVSMGGYGALRLAFKHPDLFGSVVALSPGLFKPGGASWRHGPGGARYATRERWYEKTFGEPFNMGRYLVESPFAYAPLAAMSEDMPDVLLAVGDDDYFGAYDGTLEMFLDLRLLGLKPELRVRDGGHDWSFWRAILPETMQFIDRHWIEDIGQGPAR
ncbi:esterase family protein [Roseobacter sp. YSTF-M11]|uniref:Esterase family protein n=1 Tax=Roseobacter insulae TaxID=2859783 RepID=A0A9X1FY25_9RHOB|nr:alpha/beta hydrolase family protein [Roseobacter insulae]MBW4709028.1 esterase family protein [Roseobacter insulae]